MKNIIIRLIVLIFIVSCNKDEINTDDPTSEIEENQEKEITEFDPALLKPGYPLIIIGNNFPPAEEELKVLFPVAENGNRQSLNMREGVILSRSSTEIEVVVPINAGAGMLEISFENESITHEIEVASITPEKIYYFAQGDWIETGGYGLYSLSLQPNGYLRSQVESISQEIPFNEIQSIDYNPATDSFYGISYDRLLISFGNNNWSLNCICPGECHYYSNAYCPDLNVITNTNNNKRYLLEEDRFPNGDYGFMFREIDEQGRIEWTSNLFPLPPRLYHNISFNAEQNEFIVVHHIYSKVIIYSYDAETFEVKIREVGEFEYSWDLLSPVLISYYSNELSKMYVATRRHIFEVDMENNNLININPDNPIESLIDNVYRFIYYKPTNEFFIETVRSNYGPVIHAVNRSSGETRWVGSGDSYLTEPHSPWEMKE